MKKGIMKIIILIFVLGILIISFFVNKNEYLYEYSNELTIAIQEGDIHQISELIQEEPDCVNTLPTSAPRWLQIILELPEVCYPLQTACQWGRYDVVKILLENDADCNLVWKGKWGSQSPLICTVVSGADESEQIIRLLLQYGADKRYVDESGKTAYDYAVDSENLVLQEVLK